LRAFDGIIGCEEITHEHTVEAFQPLCQELTVAGIPKLIIGSAYPRKYPHMRFLFGETGFGLVDVQTRPSKLSAIISSFVGL
jgi:hypothetical protein